MANAGDEAHDRDQVSASAAGEPGTIERPGFSGTTKVLTTIATVLLVVWFFIAWLALDRHVLDAAGESVGSAFLLLVIASVVGAIRSSR
jgi:hypothetical protein